MSMKINFHGQAILEFTFCMLVVMLMVFGVIQIFRWSGRDLVERRRAHEAVLINGTAPLPQLDTYFYAPKEFQAVWDGSRPL